MIGGAYRGIAMPNSSTDALRREVSDIFAKGGGDAENVARNQVMGFVPIIVRYRDIAAFMAERRAEYLRLARGAGLIE